MRYVAMPTSPIQRADLRGSKLCEFAILLVPNFKNLYHNIWLLICLSSFFRFDTSPVDGDYRVIDVDYDRYAVVYSCTQLLFLKYELGWILTRDPMVNQSLVSEIVFCLCH